ncbi:DUF3530 family protein [Thalassotalea sp. 1_MG-2023]|uniref:DUF3530 family protein n=1 Tax=Thalassotalea sp. 1_MG-2023 TaxID=3062680 RepID=UPI0026E47217|nr:DUF3530 family protein [Thalassotalea sp. 1_MG-2023]MDO6427079.1 DUF3530 family protein [Thalassotalea sp. 1_MG-2023]
MGILTKAVLLPVTISFILASSVISTRSFSQENQEQETQQSTSESTPEKASKNASEKTTSNGDAAPVTNEQQSPERPDISLPKALPEIYELDLKHYLPEGEYENIMVGDNEHVALVTTHDSELPKGIAILIPDWQQPATSPQAINELRKILPKQGWTTLSLQPLDKPENYPSNALDDTTKTAENAEQLAQYQQQLAPLIAASIEKAKSFPGIIILIAQGQNAAQILSILQQPEFAKPNAYIMLSAYMPTTQETQIAAEHLTELTLPILDVSLKADHFQVPRNVALRSKYVKQLAKSQYRQTTLFNFTTGYYDANALATQIKGWLTSLGW